MWLPARTIDVHTWRLALRGWDRRYRNRTFGPDPEGRAEMWQPQAHSCAVPLFCGKLVLGLDGERINFSPWKRWGSSDSLASDGMVICPRHYMCHAEGSQCHSESNCWNVLQCEHAEVLQFKNWRTCGWWFDHEAEGRKTTIVDKRY